MGVVTGHWLNERIQATRAASCACSPGWSARSRWGSRARGGSRSWTCRSSSPPAQHSRGGSHRGLKVGLENNLQRHGRSNGGGDVGDGKCAQYVGVHARTRQILERVHSYGSRQKRSGRSGDLEAPRRRVHCDGGRGHRERRRELQPAMVAAPLVGRVVRASEDKLPPQNVLLCRGSPDAAGVCGLGWKESASSSTCSVHGQNAGQVHARGGGGGLTVRDRARASDTPCEGGGRRLGQPFCVSLRHFGCELINGIHPLFGTVLTTMVPIAPQGPHCTQRGTCMASFPSTGRPGARGASALRLIFQRGIIWYVLLLLLASPAWGGAGPAPLPARLALSSSSTAPVVKQATGTYVIKWGHGSGVRFSRGGGVWVCWNMPPEHAFNRLSPSLSPHT